MSQNARVTLGKIAEETGLSRMSVSLALRGKSGISPETRERVMQAASKLGYRPDPEVSNLMSRIRSKAAPATKACLALLTPGPVSEGSRRSVTERKYVEGVLSRAKEYGYRVEEFTIDGDKEGARIGNILWNRGIEGIVVRPIQHGLTGEQSHTIPFDFARFSAIAISESLESPDLDRTLHDQYTSMLKALAELSTLGYRNIGLVLEEELNVRVNGRWTAAYLQDFFRSGSIPKPPPLILSALNQRGFDSWFDRHRPDCIMSVNRFVLQFLAHRGLDVPGEIGYASLDLDGDIPDNEGLSGIDQNSHRVGAAAVDLLVGALQRAQRGVPPHPIRIEVEGSWRHGNSTSRQRSTGIREATLRKQT